MATKREKEKLENLLDWKREGGRLSEQTKLFNRKISETSLLRESNQKEWEIEAFMVDEDGVKRRQIICFKHTSLINLGLIIMDAIDFVDKR